MNKEQTLEAIKVMQAYCEGKTIQYGINGNWIDCVETPFWNFYLNEYRIKPESNYRPFMNAEEVMDAMKEHGALIKWDGSYFNIIYFNNDSIMIGGERVTRHYKQCLQYATWADDGTPFGKLEE